MNGDRTGQSPAQEYAGTAARNYAVFVLLLAYVVSFIDRQILGLLVEPIKSDLGLSDLAFSLLHGFAFAIFYTAVGLFLGWVADRWSRRNLIIVGVIIWSIATAWCGFANTFLVLFLARIFVGVGEASLSPSAYSMISDYFPPHKRATAMSFYTLGIYIGSGIAFVLGGLVIGATQSATTYTLLPEITFKPWQLAFFLAALPGLIIVLLLLPVKEPPRREQVKEDGKSVISFVFRSKAIFLPMILGYAVVAIVTFGSMAWLPAHFIRTWSWSAQNFGLAYGFSILIFGTAGMLTAGAWADRLYARSGHSAYLRLSVIGTWLILPGAVLFAFADTPLLALIGVSFINFWLAFPVALAPAALQGLTPNHLRGQVTALYLLMINLIGMGAGPALIAILSDYGFRDEKDIGLSLAVVSIAAATLGGLALLAAAREYQRESRKQLTTALVRTG